MASGYICHMQKIIKNEKSMRRDSSALSRWFLAATNSWIHVSRPCRRCLTSRLLYRPISMLLLLCVILILVCRGGGGERRRRRRSGRCDERIDLDVMRGWGQSVSLDVWHRDSRFHFHANLPCLFLNQTWPSQADDSGGLGPGDAFCLKPDTHLLRYVAAGSMHNGKNIPLGALAAIFAHMLP